MSETRHTPAPWTVEPGCLTVRADGRPLIAAHGLAAPAVAVVVEGLAEGEANARLIAAAPDLLAALRLVLPYAESAWRTSLKAAATEAAGAAAGAGRAAIAKAEAG